MMSAARVVCAALTAVAIAAPAFAQSSLAEVARKEEARRAGVKAPSKVYSNADLKAGEVSVAGTATAEDEPCYMSASRNKCVTADEMLSITSKNVANTEAQKREPAFRDRAKTLRDRLEKAQAELKVMTATAADQSRSAAEREVAANRVADRRSDLESLEKQWLKLETDASKMAIPHEWLEPIPEISSRPPQ
jgi:hypothetical protein